MRSPLLLVVALLGLLAAGCTSLRTRPDAPAELPDAFPNHSVAQIRLQLSRTADTLHAFRARANLVLRSPAQSGQFSADLRARRADSLYLSISPGLGIEAARALVTPDSFFLYNRIENKLVYGDLDDAAGILPAPLAGADLFENLLGLGLPEANVDWSLTADTDTYVLRAPDGLRTYRVDPARWRVVHYEERTPTGDLVEERAFSEFGLFDGVYLPRRIVIRRPADETTGTLYYRSLTLNPSELSFPLRVGASAERVLVE